MERIHEDIHKIELSSATVVGKMEGFIEATNGFIASIRKDIYDKDGLLTKVGSTKNQVALQWGALFVLLMAVIGAFIAVIVKR